MSLLAAALWVQVSLVPNPADAGTPALTLQRWASVIEPRSTDCNGQIVIADPLEAEFMRISADRVGNRFVTTGAGGPGVVSFSADGRKRWEFSTCPDEIIGGFSQGWALALPDERGGAWVVERRSHSFIDLRWERIHHVDSHGLPGASIDPHVYVGVSSHGVGVIAGHLRITWTEPTRPAAPTLLRSIDFDTDGSIVSRRDITRGDERVIFGRMIAPSDGEERMLGIGEFVLSPPNTLGDEIVLSRITAQDVAEHIVTLRGPFTQMVFADDGAPWFTQYEQPRTLTRLALDGTSHSVDIAPALPDTFGPTSFAGPHAGRFLFVGDTRLALVGSDGLVQYDIATPGHVPAAYASTAPLGWLLPVSGGAPPEAAAIYGFDDLQLRARFAVDLPTFAGSSPAPLSQRSLGVDGSLVMLDQRRDPDGSLRTRVVGFALPGSAAQTRILRDNFEP